MSDVRSSEKGEKEEEKEMGKFFSFILTCLQNGKYYVIQRGGGDRFSMNTYTPFQKLYIAIYIRKGSWKKRKEERNFLLSPFKRKNGAIKETWILKRK